MSTRSLIAIQKTDQTYHAVYCHFDGYDYGDGVGPNLRRRFNTQEAAEELIALGDLSNIGNDKVIAYHRDRKEPWHQCQPKLAPTENALITLAQDAV